VQNADNVVGAVSLSTHLIGRVCSGGLGAGRILKNHYAFVRAVERGAQGETACVAKRDRAERGDIVSRAVRVDNGNFGASDISAGQASSAKNVSSLCQSCLAARDRD